MGAVNRVRYGTAKWRGKMSAHALSTCHSALLCSSPCAVDKPQTSVLMTPYKVRWSLLCSKAPNASLLSPSLSFIEKLLVSGREAGPQAPQASSQLSVLWLVPRNCKTSFCKCPCGAQGHCFLGEGGNWSSYLSLAAAICFVKCDSEGELHVCS